MKIYIATTNEGKINEIKSAFTDTEIELISLNIDFDEIEDELKKSGATNMIVISKAKAKSAIEVIKEKRLELLPVITDDTGIYFEKLNNEPGIETKSFIKKHGGIDGVKKVIAEGDVAYFQSVLSYIDQEMAEPVSFVGRLHGRLSPKDDWSGLEKSAPFGHLFIPDGYDDFLYKISTEQRKKFHHRFLAAQQLRQYILSKTKLTV